MEINIPQRLQMYIIAELGDSILYKELAKIAPNEIDRNLLLEFSRDEQSHADEFKLIYRMITGKRYDPIMHLPELKGSFEDIVRDRILDESGDYRKYGEQYLTTHKNQMLKDAYYRAMIDENLHALRLLYMLK